jgi:hypothetical protein
MADGYSISPDADISFFLTNIAAILCKCPSMKKSHGGIMFSHYSDNIGRNRIRR